MTPNNFTPLRYSLLLIGGLKYYCGEELNPHPLQVIPIQLEKVQNITAATKSPHPPPLIFIVIRVGVNNMLQCRGRKGVEQVFSVLTHDW